MIKAKQIQTHKRDKTHKARQRHIVEDDKSEDRLDDELTDKSDTEDTSCVEKINIFQHNIDQLVDRDRQVAKAEEERENTKTSK
eukprot:4618646-Heterocapsa_arctica.AAC.1